MNILWDKKKFTKYLIWSFSVAWILQIIASIFARRGNQILFSILLSITMFAPLFATVMAKIPLKGMGFKPKLKGNIPYIVAAWLLPSILSALGAILYFVIFPSRLDLTGKYMIASLGDAAFAQMQAQGLTIELVVLISFVQTITYVPFLNMFFALGEEVGWRGAMQPMLKDRFGKSKGRIIGGIIWGAWHWPVMVLAGYEYGLEYWGAPFLGMALFCLVTVVIGTLFDVAYEKTNCIWVPSLAHGAFNGFAALPLLVLDPQYMDQMTLGPAAVGIVGILPSLLLAIVVLIKQKD